MWVRLDVVEDTGQADIKAADLLNPTFRTTGWESTRVWVTVVSPVAVVVTLRRKVSGGDDTNVVLPAAAGVVLNQVLVDDITNLIITGPEGTWLQVSGVQLPEFSS